MVSSLLVLAGFFLLLEPLLVLAHELGHAAIVLASGENARVALGGNEGKRFDVGPLALVLRPRGLASASTYGLCYYDVELGRWRRIAFALAGPAVTVLLLAVAMTVGADADGALEEMASFAAIYLAIQAVLTLLPVQYPSFMGPYAGIKSDGRVALELLLGWSEAPNAHLSAPTAAED